MSNTHRHPEKMQPIYRAEDVYINFRVYQHYLQENNLENDSDTISVEDLMEYVENIDPEDYKRIKEFVVEAY